MVYSTVFKISVTHTVTHTCIHAVFTTTFQVYLGFLSQFVPFLCIFLGQTKTFHILSSTVCVCVA